MSQVAAYIEQTPFRAQMIINRDPTRTTTLRSIYANDIARRFTMLAKIIKTSITTEDVFGLIVDSTLSEITILQDFTTPGIRAFNFPRDSRKVIAFINWLNQQIEAGILDVSDFTQVGESINSAWQNKYIFEAYKKGVNRARQQLTKEGMIIPSILDSGGINVVLATLVHIDRLGVLYTRAFNELKGISDGMAQLISKLLTTGLVEGQGPAVIARTLVHAITGTGETLGLPISYVTKTGKLVEYIMPAKQRAIILARTEIIRAHALGQLQEFKNWGIQGVSVLAELQTAGDDRVCEECSSLEGNVYTIEQATSIIPVHRQCRCIWLPRVLN